MKTSTQQINLYQTQFRKTRVRFSAVKVVQLSVLLIAGLAVTSWFENQQLIPLRERAESASRQALGLESQLTSMRELQSVDVTELAQHNISDLKKTRLQKQQVLGNLGKQDEHQNRLFSSYFEGLARRTLDGLWLKEVDVAAGGESIRLVGSVVEAELVPKWIKALQQESAFSGTRFRSARLTSAEEGAGFLQFSLQTSNANDSDTGQ